MSTVFITGSGRRIGRNLALLFAKSGWNVGLHCNNSVEMAEKTRSEILAMGRVVSLVQFDVRDISKIRAGFVETCSKIGVPDVLVNCAGVFPERTALEGISQEMWDDTMNINIRAAMFCSQIFAELCKNEPPAERKIINIASLGGLEIWKQRIPYNVSKAALIQLTKALARDLAPNFAVNAVCPGTILVPDEPAKSEIDVSKIPMQRYGTVADLFSAVNFFAECPNFITGQILNVDGGNHLIK